MKICKNCVMDETDSNIMFDEHGVCDHCSTFSEKYYQIGIMAKAITIN